MFELIDITDPFEEKIRNLEPFTIIVDDSKALIHGDIINKRFNDLISSGWQWRSEKSRYDYRTVFYFYYPKSISKKNK